MAPARSRNSAAPDKAPLPRVAREPAVRCKLADAVVAGERGALARAITLIESTSPRDRALASDLLRQLLPHTGKAIRLGLTGAPGVGKSTFIDQLGLNLIASGSTVAVLAIDPSSTRSGGSILADKTRMGRLSVERDAFIRPSPSAGTLGGSARRTRETMLVCEAAGFDAVLVETVGVGQSEAVIADIVDFVAVLVQPGGGDELQGLKRGILEAANMIAVTKADGPQAAIANRTASDYRAALNIVVPEFPDWRAPVLLTSALANEGLDKFWETVLEHRAVMDSSGRLDSRRREQDVRRLNALIEEELVRRYRSDPHHAETIAKLEDEVRAGRLTPGIAADRALGRGEI